MMSKPMGDRNLLVGLLAWQKKFISSDVLVAAMNAWALAKGKGLAQILREQRALTENQHALLEETVFDHLSRHGNDAKKCLTDLSSVDLVKQELAKIADPDVQASLAHVATAKAKVEPEPIMAEVIEAEDLPKAKPVKAAPKKSAAPSPQPQAKAASGGIPTWALLAGGVLFAGFGVLIVLMSIVLVVVLTRDNTPIVQVKPGDEERVKPIVKEVEKDGDKAVVKEPVKVPIIPVVDPPVVSRKPTEVIGEAEWRVEGDELVVNNPVQKRAYLYFGSKEWTDYDFSFETKSEARNQGTIAIFRATDEANHYALSLGAFLRTKYALSRVEKGQLTYDMPHVKEPFHLDRWYAVRIETRGTQIRCIVDDQKIFEYTNDAHAKGQVALGATNEAKARWKKIKVTTPDGKVLWDGLPDLSGKKADPVVVVDKDFVPLFNGKDLTGWKDRFGDGWRVDKGVLIGSAAANRTAVLHTEAKFQDFHLRAEVRSGEKNLAKLGFRSADGLLHGYNASMVSLPTGDVRVGIINAYTGKKSFTLQRLLPEKKIPPGQWFNLEVIAQGNRFVVLVNGQKTTDAIDASMPDAGVLSLSLSGAEPVEFRKIEIKEFKPAPIIVDKDFVPLFNGKDLTGWKPHAQQPGEWRVVDGILTGFSAVNGYLFSTRGDYKDFHLRVEGRAKAGKAGGVRFRYAQELQGYETTLNSRTAGMIHIRKDGVRNLGQLIVLPPDEWTTLDIIAQGNRLQLKVNGKTTVDAIDVKNASTSGHICLYDFKESIEFRKIEIKEFAPAAPPVVLAEDFVPLFNGKDLTGWKTHPKQPGDWRVVDGILTGRGPAASSLYTVGGDYRNFYLRVEARINDRGVGAVFSRASFGPLSPANAPNMPVGYRAIINSTHPTAFKTGGFFIVSDKPFGGGVPQILPPGEWMTLEIIAEDKRLILRVKGKQVGHIIDSKALFPTGHIALNLDDPASVLEFRKIEIKALQPGDMPPDEQRLFVAGELTPLFNGKDLTGWKTHPKQPGDWRVVDGILVGRGPGISSLYTERGDYKDFQLTVEARINAAGLGAVVTRAPFGPMTPPENSTSPLGFHARLNNGNLFPNRTGSLILREPVGVTTSDYKSKIPAGEWFTFELRVTNYQARVSINGRFVSAVTDEKRKFTTGHIGLFLENPETIIEFRKIEIREMHHPDAVLNKPLVKLDIPGGADPPQMKRFPFSVPASNMGKWRVENNELVHDLGKSPMSIFFGDPKWTDYDFSVDAMKVAGKDQFGLWFRRADANHSFIFGLGARQGGTHMVALMEPADIKHQQPLLAAKEPLQDRRWYNAKISVRGEKAACYLDGVKLFEFKSDQLPAGGVGLRTWVTAYRFKNIKVTAPDGTILLEGLPDWVLDKAVVPPLPIVAAGEFVPLFNGKDLTGWQPHEMFPGKWRVENGILTGDGPDIGMLHTTRNDYKDFHLRLEARFNVPATGSSSGVLCRSEFGRFGYESLFLAGKLTDGIHVRAKGVAGKIPPALLSNVKSGDWFTLEFIAQGNRLKVLANGKETADFLDEAKTFASGHIALRQGPASKLEFRKIEVKEFNVVAAVPAAPPEGFVQLFNGKDLTGWKGHKKMPGVWRVENGILNGDAAGKASGFQHTERPQAKDFHLRLEARVSDKGSGDVLFRCPDGSLLGYQVTINSTLPVVGNTGSLYAQIPGRRVTLVSVKQPLVPANQWFTMEILAEGNRLIVKVNGQTTADIMDETHVPAAGHIVLHSANSTVEFRRVDIKELKPGAAPAFVPVGDFAPLFNAKDLAGWQTHPKRPGNWSVEKGILTGSAPDGGDLVSTRGDFKDFHLRADVRVNDKGNGKLFFRAAFDPMQVPLKTLGYEALINQKPGGAKTGALTATSTASEAYTSADKAPAPPGDWLTLEIVARGNLVTVKVNGFTVTEFVDEKRKFATSGHIVLHQDANAMIEFRKVELVELAPAAVAPPKIDVVVPPKAEGFVPLFNGKDLTGWQPHAKKPGNWKVENGILTGSAPAGGSLYSTRGDYKDFHLRVEARINDKGFGRVFFRAAYDPTKIPIKTIGYEALINQRLLGDKTGTLTVTSSAKTMLTTAKESAVRPGEWFTLDVVVKGDLVTVQVNGVTVAEFQDEKGQFARNGHIVLHQDPNGVLEFRKVEIKDLAAP